MGSSLSAQASCSLQSSGNKIQHVVHITFDNVHLRRDNPNVPSDLEQMPNLLNFLQQNGIVTGNHAMATLEVGNAIVQSARERREIMLRHQCARSRRELLQNLPVRPRANGDQGQ